MEASEKAEVYRDFKTAVNMPPAMIAKWLDTDESKRVGWKSRDGSGSGESVGHQSGRHIVAIKRKKKAELTAADYAHMVKVVGYVARHKVQGPARDKRTSDWRYSLMNWGHDPLKS
jgi:ribosomal protein L11